MRNHLHCCVWRSDSLRQGILVCARRDMAWAYSYPAVLVDVIEWYTHPETTPADIYFFYIFEIGFYTHSIYAHCFTETRRKDFVEMLVHHIATVLLVVCSFGLRLLGCGVVLLILHDISDVLFEIAKQLIYRRRETDANIVFALWVLSWIITRLIYFPLHVIRGAVWGTISVLGTFPLVGALAVFIFTLFILHIVWTFMIFAMIYRMMTGQAERIRDTREDTDDIVDEKPTEKSKTKSDGAAATKKDK